MFKNILLAVDGSEHGKKAAEIAGGLARQMKSELWVVVAYDPIPPYIGQPNFQHEMNARLSHSDAILAEAMALVGELDDRVHKQILEGPPAEAILAVAETRQVDLIVMGTRGLGRLAGLLLGSQSQKVAAHASCPVMLVR